MMAEPIDDFAQRIMERTRERREMLAKKMAETSPRRKRSSPRSSSQLQNITNTPLDSHDDSPNKRTCVRDLERSVHDDTPAVRGVKTRMNALAETRKHWRETDGDMDVGANDENVAPLAQPCFDGVDGADEMPVASPRPNRKARFAALAQNMNNWEDDLSHPTIKKDDKPKKVWQRPAPRPEDGPTPVGKPPIHNAPSRDEPAAPSKPPRTYEYETGSPTRENVRPNKFVSPSRTPLEDALSPPKARPTNNTSPNKKVVSSVTVMLSNGGASTSVSSLRERQPSPQRTTSSSVTSLRGRQASPQRNMMTTREREPSPFRSTSSSVVREPSPFRNSSSRLRAPSPARSATQAQSPGRTTSSSAIRAPSPGRNPTLGNAVPRPYGSPAKLVTSTTTTDTAHAERVSQPAVQQGMCKKSRPSDVFEPTKKPVADRLNAWRQRTDGGAPQNSGVRGRQPQKSGLSAMERLAPRVESVMDQSMLPEDDPLNMSLHSRLNVWETKIHRTAQEKEEDARLERELHVAKQRQASGGKPSAAPTNTAPASVRGPSPIRSVRAPSPAKGPSPIRSVRAPSPGRPVHSAGSVTTVGSKSPLNKSPGPSKVGQATRAVQDRLNAFANNWQSNEIAEKIRLQKERDMEVLTSRWKTGVHAGSDRTSSGQPDQDRETTEHISGAKTTGVPPAPAPPSITNKSPPRTPGISQHREQARDVMRKVLPNGGGDYETKVPTPQHFEEKLQMMGFAVESDAEHKHKATADLTPYRERDRQARAQQASNGQQQQPPSNHAAAAKKPPIVRVEDTKVTQVKFKDSQRDTVVTKDAARSMVSSTTVFTPSKPSTAYAQHNAAGKTPSIYALIKKTGGPTAYQAPSSHATPESLKKPTTGRKDSFSDDSFESQDDARAPVKRTVHFGSDDYGGSQESLASQLTETSQETDSQAAADTGTDSVYSDTEHTEATTADDYDSREEESDSSEEEDEEGGNVSELLDDAFSDCEQAPAAAHAHQQPVPQQRQPAPQQQQHYTRNQQPLSPQPVPRRIKPKDSRAPRPQTLQPQDSDVESVSSGAGAADYYGTRSNRCSAPSSKRVKFQSPGGRQYNGRSGSSSGASSSGAQSESESERPYSIDLYRNSKSKMNAPVPKMTIVRHSNSHQQEMAKQEPLPYTPTKTAKQRLTELQERVNQEQSIIMQTSNALNQCCGSNSSFAGSQEAVECHKLLLIACKKREAYIGEMHKLRQGWGEPPKLGPQGSLTISDIKLPLKQQFMQNIGGPNDLAQHYFLLLVRHGDHVVFTQMVGTHDAMVAGSLDIPNMIKFSDISQDFRLEVEVYGMSIRREEPTAKSKKQKTPKKLLKSGASSSRAMKSPGGPAAVRSTNFVLVGHMLVDAAALSRTHFSLDGVPYSSPLHGTAHMRLRCVIECAVVERGFLTIFEDVSGFGAWHRRWFVLKDTRLAYWKYPDDEKHMEPMGWLEMKQVVTDTVGLIPRDICARPNTFELITVRRQGRNETDTLTSRCYNTMTTTKHWLSADTKEERMLWCNKLNEALVNIRTWHSDALRPIKQKDFVQPYNPYPGKGDERSCVIPFNPHDQQSSV